MEILIFGVDLETQQILVVQPNRSLNTFRLLPLERVMRQVTATCLHEGDFQCRVTSHWLHKLETKCGDRVKCEHSYSLNPSSE